jgi:hypothetical protein
VREYYAYALIAGVSVNEARHLLPGFIQDMYVIWAKYDARMAGVQFGRKMGL